MQDRTSGISDIDAVRRDLRGLVALEWLQTGVAIAALVFVAVHGVLASGNVAAALGTGMLVVTAVALLGLGIRLRAGHDTLRRELDALELRAASSRVEVSVAPEGVEHPYRAAPGAGPRATDPSPLVRVRRRHVHLLLEVLVGAVVLLAVQLALRS